MNSPILRRLLLALSPRAFADGYVSGELDVLASDFATSWLYVVAESGKVIKLAETVRVERPYHDGRPGNPSGLLLPEGRRQTQCLTSDGTTLRVMPNMLPIQ